MRKIFLENLVKHNVGTNKGSINWSKSIGCVVKFIYDDIEGELKLISHNKNNHSIIVEYENKEYLSYTPHFIHCRIRNILELVSYDFIYKINDTVTTKTGVIIITKQFSKENKRWYKYRCLKCNYEDGEISENNLGKLKGCPVCSNQKIIKGTNDIATTHPYLIKYFVDIEEAYKYSYSSSKKVKMLCPHCSFKKDTRIAELTKQGFSCPKCGDGISFPNKAIFNVLDQCDIDFTTEFAPKWGKYLLYEKWKQCKYDFYFKINDKEYIIEADGGQHKKGMMNTSYETQKYIDTEKDRLAKENNIFLIRIDCEKSEIDFIKNNILHSKMAELIDLSKVDWNRCLKFCVNNLIKKACFIWNIGIKNTLEIGSLLKLNRSTIIKYLKLGTQLDWTDYDPNEEKRKNSENCGKLLAKLLSKKIMCLETKEIFASCQELSRLSEDIFGFKMYPQAISLVCNNKRKSIKGYHFKYILN